MMGDQLSDHTPLQHGPNVAHERITITERADNEKDEQSRNRKIERSILRNLFVVRLRRHSRRLSLHNLTIAALLVVGVICIAGIKETA